jgi:hypothetical protein
MDTSNEISVVYEQVQENIPSDLVERFKTGAAIGSPLEEIVMKGCSWATCFCVVTFDLELGQS